MSRSEFAVEVGLKITGENSQTGPSILQGFSAPGGDSNSQDSAEIGSAYLRSNGTFYIKKFSTNAAADWLAVTDSSLLKLRNNSVRAATGDSAPTTGSVIDLTSSPFGDDAAPKLTAADFSVDDEILFGVGGSPKLMRVSVVSSPNITVVDVNDTLAEGDLIFIKTYLPDSPDDQESQAIVSFVGGEIKKVADVNWNFADGINLQASITDRNGPVSGSDTLQVAVEKLEGDAKDLSTLSGVGRGSVNLGTFTGRTIADNRTNKQALQDLESALEARSQITGVTTITTLDSVLVDDVKMSKWMIHAFEEASPANTQSMEVVGLHNGTASADASGTPDQSVAFKLKQGSNFNLSITIDLNGTGAAQVMRVRAASTSAGVTVTARRIELA